MGTYVPRCPECGHKLKKKEQVCTDVLGCSTVDEYAQVLHEEFHGDNLNSEFPPWNLHQPYNDNVVQVWREAAQLAVDHVKKSGIGSF